MTSLSMRSTGDTVVRRGAANYGAARREASACEVQGTGDCDMRFVSSTLTGFENSQSP
ncbi:Uncharacterised protein [Burkholderia pseudomallei]|nr:hypothetical protein DO66_3778 [Burkholderia pseudomallei]KGV45476.1 hypothetical protein X985_283 [Burkholderia pseudomallei MSHR4012]KGW35767.1 hypothetical protein Y047_5217 [Burkholderia pseudomallei MSHR3016]CAJ2775066.1 Uncharacterised protein [Burkholderia pseudomallei]CAJ2785656.1 Uncharacterised protein [Burkholderia pseudomallei]